MNSLCASVLSSDPKSGQIQLNSNFRAGLIRRPKAHDSLKLHFPLSVGDRELYPQEIPCVPAQATPGHFLETSSIRDHG